MRSRPPELQTSPSVAQSVPDFIRIVSFWYTVVDGSNQSSGRKPTFLLAAGNMKRTDAISRIEEIIAPVALAAGLEIVEIELKGAGRHQMLRIVIDKPGGVTHGDCEIITREAGDLIRRSRSDCRTLSTGSQFSGCRTAPEKVAGLGALRGEKG